MYQDPFFWGFVALVNIIILYLIIKGATKATLRAKYEKAQLNLLAMLARREGVEEQEIENALKDAGL